MTTRRVPDVGGDFLRELAQGIAEAREVPLPAGDEEALGGSLRGSGGAAWAAGRA